MLLVVMVCIVRADRRETRLRGLLRGPFAARINDVPAWPAASALFALVHFRPVGVPRVVGDRARLGGVRPGHGRLGMAIACHVGFNVTGLLLALG